jgi:hypothetical protein
MRKLISKQQSGGKTPERKWLDKDQELTRNQKVIQSHQNESGFSERMEDDAWGSINALGSLTPMWPVFAANEAGRQIDRGEYGKAAVEGAMIGVPYGVGAGVKALSPIIKKGINNVYKINPWAFKPNSEAYYRGIGRTGLDDALESGVIRPHTRGAFDKLYFTDDIGHTNIYAANKGKGIGDPFADDDSWRFIEPKDPKKYIAEIPKKDIPLAVSATKGTRNGLPAQGPYYTSEEFPSINNVKFYKENWLQGYKEIPKKEIIPLTHEVVPRNEETIMGGNKLGDVIESVKLGVRDARAEMGSQVVGDSYFKNIATQKRFYPEDARKFFTSGYYKGKLGRTGTDNLYQFRKHMINKPSDLTFLEGDSVVKGQMKASFGPRHDMKISPYNHLNNIRRTAAHEQLHGAYFSENSFMPVENIKLNRIMKPWRQIDEIGNKVGLKDIAGGEGLSGYLSNTSEVLANTRDLGKVLGVRIGSKYPGYSTFKESLDNYSGSKNYLRDSFKLNTPVDYKHVFDIMNRTALGVTGAAVGINALKEKGTK